MSVISHVSHIFSLRALRHFRLSVWKVSKQILRTKQKVSKKSLMPSAARELSRAAKQGINWWPHQKNGTAALRGDLPVLSITFTDVSLRSGQMTPSRLNQFNMVLCPPARWDSCTHPLRKTRTYHLGALCSQPLYFCRCPILNTLPLPAHCLHPPQTPTHVALDLLIMFFSLKAPLFICLFVLSLSLLFFSLSLSFFFSFFLSFFLFLSPLFCVPRQPIE